MEDVISRDEPCLRQNINGSNKVIFRFASVLIYGILFILGTNVLIQHTGLWYWTPITGKRWLRFFALNMDDKNYDILIIGSSVSRLGFLPGLMEEELSDALPRKEPWLIYNVSVDGGLLPTHLDVMRMIVGKRQKPKLVLMLMGVRAFNGAGGYQLNREIRFFSRTFKDLFMVLRYSPRTDTKWKALNAFTHGLETILQAHILTNDIVEKIVLEFQTRHGSSYYYPFTKKAIRKNKRVYGRPKITFERWRQRMGNLMRLNEINNFQITPMIERWFLEIFKEARRKDVTLVILLAPNSEWLLNNIYYKEKQIAVEYLTEICKREGITWYDLGKEPFRPDDSDYRDGCNHLGPEGAAKLSRAVTRHIIVPLFSGP